MKSEIEKTSNIQTGQHQIAQILKEFEMGCDEAIIRREGKRLILEPNKRSLSIPEGAQSLRTDFPQADTLFGDFRF